MKKVVLKKIFLLGVLLFAVQFIPFAGSITNPQVANAASEEETDNIRLNIKSNKKLVLGDKSVLRVYNLEESQKAYFKSSDSNIVDIQKETRNKAILVANEVGSAKISVTIRDGFWKVKTITITVKVGPPAQSVKLIDSKIVLKVGEKTTLRAILKPGNTVEEGRFKSSEPDIASVTSSTGYVKALSPGTALITVTIPNGGKDTCTIKVVD